MTDETTLPEQWQELPEVREMVDKAVGEARAALVAQRDVLKRELQQMKQQLQKMRETPTAKQSAAEGQEAKKPGSGSPQQEQQRLQDQAELVTRLQGRIKELEAELQAKDQRLAAEVLERGIRDAVSKVGEVHKDAWADVIARGKALFSIDEQGRPVARDASGNVVYGKDGVTPMDFAGWAAKLMAEAPHLFKASSGAGSGTAKGAGSQQGASPVVITKEQARNPLIYRRAKERAAKLGSELLIQ